MRIRPLTDDDFPQSRALSALAFGGDPEATPTPPRTPFTGVGAFDDAGRLVGNAIGRDYAQWWGGRQVPMLGVASVAVHPASRGRGLLRALMDALVAGCEQPISVLFPTAAGIYRRLGWEIVGSLDDTPVPLSALPRGQSQGHGQVRSATDDDLPALTALYAARGAQTNGLLTRTGPCFPTPSLSGQVTTVAVEAGAVAGYLSYDRGRGYHGDGQLRLRDCVAATPGALRALLGSLASWDSVVGNVLWRGPTDELALQLGGSVPPPSEVQAWMLRVLDPVAAVAARGFRPGAVTARFAVVGNGRATGHVLEVQDGRGVLTEVDGQGLPLLAVQGLALLFAGADQSRLLRLGLLDRPVPGLDGAFAGPPTEIGDYF